MNAFFDYLERLKGQPHPVRRRIATISAAGAAAFVGLLWFGTSLAMGGYALKSGSFAQSSLEATEAPATRTSQLAGATAADAAASAPAHIEVVDIASSSPHTRAEPTVIPF